MTGTTWSEMMRTMNEAYKQHQRGERPTIVPEYAKFVDGVYWWEDENIVWSWEPGAPAFSAWSKDIYVSSRISTKVEKEK